MTRIILVPILLLCAAVSFSGEPQDGQEKPNDQKVINGHVYIENKLVPYSEKLTLNPEFEALWLDNVTIDNVLFEIQLMGNDKLYSAAVRVAYTNPPEEIIKGGEAIGDAEAWRYLLGVIKSTRDLPPDDIGETSITKDNLSQIEIQSTSFVIPTPRNYKINMDAAGSINDATVIRFTELNPPFRKKKSDVPFCAIIDDDINKGKHGWLAFDEAVKEYIELKIDPDRLDHTIIGKNFQSYALTKDGTVIATFFNLKKTVFLGITYYPEYSRAAQVRAISIHQSWRDAILAANKE